MVFIIMLKKLFFLSLFFFSTLSSSILILNDTKTKYTDFTLSYHHDETRNLGIEKIDFTQDTHNKFTFGDVEGDTWFKLSIKNNSSSEKIIIYLSEPCFEVVDLFYLEMSKWHKQSLGYNVPLDQRDIGHANPSFIVKIPHNTQKVFYIKTYSEFQKFGQFQVYTDTFTVPSHQTNTLILFMFLCGVILIIIFISFFLYLKFKDILFAYYVVYAIFWFIFVFFLSGLNLYFDLAQYYYMYNVAGPLSLMFLVLFSMNFLRVKEFSYFFYLVLTFLSLCYGAIAVLSIVDTSWSWYMLPLTALSYFVLLIASLKNWRMGINGAKYFTLAIAIDMITVIANTALGNNLIPNTDLSRYSFLFASLSEMGIFMLLLTYRLNDIRLKTLQTKNELLYLQNNEQELLEEEIDKRTQDISHLLQEKEILLQEVYHGTGKNLQLMTTLLELECIKDNNSYLLGVIKRITSMEIIHKHLYSNTLVYKIDTRDYFSIIIDEIEHMYGIQSIDITKNIDTFHLNIDHAIHMGMILSELISNSIKYNNQKTCKINFDLTLQEDHIEFHFRDNGPGFTPSQKNKGLGLQFIKQFTDKFPNSSCAFTNKQGSHFDLSFTL